MSMISDTGMALEVPVAFLSGVSSAVITLAATGSDTAQKKQGGFGLQVHKRLRGRGGDGEYCVIIAVVKVRHNGAQTGGVTGSVLVHAGHIVAVLLFQLRLNPGTHIGKGAVLRQYGNAYFLAVCFGIVIFAAGAGGEQAGNQCQSQQGGKKLFHHSFSLNAWC